MIGWTKQNKQCRIRFDTSTFPLQSRFSEDLPLQASPAEEGDCRLAKAMMRKGKQEFVPCS